MRAALLLLLCLGCETSRSAEQQSDAHAAFDLWTREQGDRNASSNEHVTRAPVITVTEGTLTIPPGSVIETPAGKVTTPIAGPPAKLDFHEKEKAGVVNETKTSGETEHTDKTGGVKATADERKDDKSQKKSDVASWSFGTKLAIGGIALAVILVALLIAGFVFKDSPVGKLLGSILPKSK